MFKSELAERTFGVDCLESRLNRNIVEKVIVAVSGKNVNIIGKKVATHDQMSVILHSSFLLWYFSCY